MIHPYFEAVPDKYVAQVLSEVMVPGEYKNNHSLKDTPFTPADGFPPEPAYLSSMTAAFIERDGQSIRRIAMHNISGRDVTPTYSELVSAYESTVSLFQDIASAIEPDVEVTLGLEKSHYKFGRLGNWAIEATKRSGHRLIAAHLVFKAAHSDRIHGGLSYPTLIKEEFPLLVRDSIAGVIFEMKKSGVKEEGLPDIEYIPEDLQGNIRKILVNDESTTIQAGIPASTVMPTLASFRVGLKQSRQGR